MWASSNSCVVVLNDLACWAEPASSLPIKLGRWPGEGQCGDCTGRRSRGRQRFRHGHQPCFRGYQWLLCSGNRSLGAGLLSCNSVPDFGHSRHCGTTGRTFAGGKAEPNNSILSATGCAIPSSARAYSLNFTVVPSGPLSFLSTWPTGQVRPLVSTLNIPTGTITANAAIVPAGNGGSVDVYATDNAHLVIDIDGYFATPAPGGLSFYTVTPCRIFDSRFPLPAPAIIGPTDVSIAMSSAAFVYRQGVPF